MYDPYGIYKIEYLNMRRLRSNTPSCLYQNFMSNGMKESLFNLFLFFRTKKNWYKRIVTSPNLEDDKMICEMLLFSAFYFHFTIHTEKNNVQVQIALAQWEDYFVVYQLWKNFNCQITYTAHIWSIFGISTGWFKANCNFWNQCYTFMG